MSALEKLQVGAQVARMSNEEWEARVNLAACYRLVHHFGLTDLIYNHITLNVPGEPGVFLTNPFGLAYDEVTASSLVKIDVDGNIMSDTPYRINRAGFIIHSAIHIAREDAKCVLHTHSRYSVALACMEGGLVPMTQGGLQFYNRLSYHDYEGFNVNADERARLVESLGSNNAMVLRNHGVLTVGETVGKAFQRMYFLEQAAMVQLDVLKSGKSPYLPSVEVCEATAKRWADGTSDASANDDIEWAALVRQMDRCHPGFRA
ncbi:class II aldolase/adducin family protein [Rhizobium sp. Root1203]|uniref:class II aldolase/adducin family protein n=1 Tax=Rhizobium sp. Root1203 TaxID=1736427 RepID=UPI000B12545B|nr:class II aldolase/adducin family protein [Rhizobium sp. Root1203]